MNGHIGMEKMQYIRKLDALFRRESIKPLNIQKISAAIQDSLEVKVLVEACEAQICTEIDEQALKELPKGNPYSDGKSVQYSTPDKVKLALFGNKILRAFTGTQEYKALLREANRLYGDRFPGVSEFKIRRMSGETLVSRLQRLPYYERLVVPLGGCQLPIVPCYPGLPGDFYWIMINGLQLRQRCRGIL